MITSLISGLPRRETCCHGPEADIVPFALRTRFFCRLARGPHAEDGVGIVRAGRRRVVLGQLAERDADGDRVRVEPADAVDAGLGRERKRVEGVERAEPGKVEDRAEVDEEGVVALAGEEPWCRSTAS